MYPKFIHPAIFIACLLAGNLTQTHAQEAQILRDFTPGSASTFIADWMVESGDLLYFSIGSLEPQLWRTDGTDGTDAGTLELREYIAAIAEPPVAFKGRIYFPVEDDEHGVELHVSDGTPGGTQLLTDIRTGTAWADPSDLTPAGDLMYFIATDNDANRELWLTDGTPEGTQPLLANPDEFLEGEDPQIHLGFGNDLYFSTSIAAGRGLGTALYRTDGTTQGTVLIRQWDESLRLSRIDEMVVFGGRPVFTIGDNTHGMELWESDGTTSNTRLLVDVEEGVESSFPSELTVAGNLLFFRAQRSGSGKELHVTDGTPGGTLLLADFLAGNQSSNIDQMTAGGAGLFFRLTVPFEGNLLYASDGTTQGTRLVKRIVSADMFSNLDELTGIGGRLYFQTTEGVSGLELWTSDGTEAGTRLYADIETGASSSSPRTITAFDGAVYMSAQRFISGREIYKVLPENGAVGWGHYY